MKTESIIEVKLPKFVVKQMKKNGSDNIKSYDYGDCAIIVSRNDGRWHYSISHANRITTFDEIMKIKSLLFPDIMMEMASVSQQSNCFIVHFFESTVDKNKNFEKGFYH